MFRGEPQADGRLLLGPTGSVTLLNDSGAQISVTSEEYAGMLVEREPAPANLRVFGACNSPSDIKGIGYLYLVFSSAPFAAHGFQRLFVQGIAAQYRLGIISAHEGVSPRVNAPRTSRGRDRRYGPTPLVTPTPQRSTTLAAAARLGIFEASAFAALSRTSRGLLAPFASELEFHPEDW